LNVPLNVLLSVQTGDVSARKCIAWLEAKTLAASALSITPAAAATWDEVPADEKLTQKVDLFAEFGGKIIITTTGVQTNAREADVVGSYTAATWHCCWRIGMFPDVIP
jgi:hypothetical protein